jgi:hypothetical protein
VKTPAELALDRIEAILAEIEQLDAASGGRFRQASDRESFDVVCRIERKMQQNMGNGDGPRKETAGA